MAYLNYVMYSDPNHQIIGQAFAGALTDCSSTFRFLWFGRFDKSWEGDQTSTGSLKSWLDPLNTNATSQHATFLLGGSNKIPCPGLRQDLHAPSIKKNDGTLYSYQWQSSPHILIFGTGPNAQFVDDGNCTGCAGWVQCSISTPSSCGSQLVAVSVPHQITWTNPVPATNFKHTIYPPTNNNGNYVGPFNNICAFGLYTIKVGYEGIPVPSNTVFTWTTTGNIITAYPSSDGWYFTFYTNSPGIFTATIRVVAGTGCLVGKTETYVFQVLSPCSSPFDVPFLDTRSSDELDKVISIYPNPVSSELKIELPDELIERRAVVQVIDAVGKFLHSMLPWEPNSEIDISHFPAGSYIVRVVCRDMVFHRKIQILHNR